MASPARTPRTDSREDSVMVALGELARLEADRATEETSREQLRREEARRAREAETERLALEFRRQEERAAERRALTEAEARLRVEAELAQDKRLGALKAELARVAAERERMHRSVVEASRPAPTPSGRGWALAFGLSSVVAAALAGLVVMQAQTAPRVIEVERQVIVTVPAAAPLDTVPAGPAVVTAPPAPTAAEARAAAASAPAHRMPRRRAGTRPEALAAPHGDGLDFGDDGDVIGGLEHEATDMSGVRRRQR